MGFIPASGESFRISTQYATDFLASHILPKIVFRETAEKDHSYRRTERTAAELEITRLIDFLIE